MLGDLLLQRGTNVLVLFETTLGDEMHFQNPQTFDPDRWAKDNQ